MIETLPEGRTYIVHSKSESGNFKMGFQSWEDVEEYITKEPGVFKITSVDCYDVPLTGLKLMSRSTTV